MSIHRKSVFISYAHEDRKWVDSFLRFLSPWVREKRVSLWDDSKIKAGERWENKIASAIDEASVAVLLVSTDFLSSDFIMNFELPRVLQKTEKNEIQIIWVAVGRAAYELSPLDSFQAANNPEKPLESLNVDNRNKALLDIARQVGNAITLGNLAGGLEIVDDTAEPLEAALDKRSEKVGRRYGVQAEFVPAEKQIKFQGANSTITVQDIEKLPEEDREFIADLEDALRRNYTRWSKIREGLGNAGGSLDHEIDEQLLRVSKIMCRDLNHILDEKL